MITVLNGFLIAIILLLGVGVWWYYAKLQQANAEIARLKRAVSKLQQAEDGSGFAQESAALTAQPAFDAPLAEQADHLLHRLMPGTLVQGETAVAGTPTPVPAQTNYELVRIIEETVMNMLRHTKPTKIQVTLDYTQPDQFILRIIDNGKGFDPLNPTAGFGLTNVREKAMRINGRVSFNMKPEGGSELICVVPHLS